MSPPPSNSGEPRYSFVGTTCTFESMIFIFQRCGYLPWIPQVKGYLLYSHLSNVQKPYDIPSSRLVPGILILLHYSPCMQYLGRISCFHPLSTANIKGQLGVTRNSVPMVFIVFQRFLIIISHKYQLYRFFLGFPIGVFR